jgi:hypothetical protein
MDVAGALVVQAASSSLCSFMEKRGYQKHLLAAGPEVATQSNLCCAVHMPVLHPPQASSQLHTLRLRLLLLALPAELREAS